MEVEVAVLMEVSVDSHRHMVADAEYGAEGVGARTQVSYRAQEFHRESLFLERVFLGIGRAIYFQFGQLISTVCPAP